MKYIVCMKITPKVEQIKFDEVSKTIIREGVENEINEADKNALEMALKIKEKRGGEVIIVSMGPPFFENFLKIAIAMGADDAILLSDKNFRGSDTFSTSLVLAKAIEKIKDFDIVFCGEASSDGSTEQVPPAIAEWLNIPQITYAFDVKLENGKVIAKRRIRGGYEIVESKIPVLISTELGCNVPRFPDFRRKRWAEREFKVKFWNMENLGLNPSLVGIEGSYTIVKELRQLKAFERKREFIKGDPEFVAKKIAEIISKFL